ncbi:uncharacterized protein F5891DRAFT_954398 [Suillus fuscotomentosus]|uniref:Uncharacterized protein n=1 Tax=Suillus fuscotomentosus TaxID=1912939 RepID=A0AAD4E3X7_9AGAM|nr:uncharacterized protein F5891DRAFT_954398 [Suillus fuscotomentosus]KAG1899273.1 hypothetical protein F5891DRAFT_954398 [Suillus fuscotomentosus]
MLSEDDIYRGKVPSALPIIAESVAPASSTSSLTSSGSFIAGRLGALAAVLENAITRWARRRSSSASTSSSSPSSTSFRSSIYTPSRHRHSRRRKRPTSFANMRSTHSEREVAARLRVRQEIRCVDRGYTLYLPPGLNPEITMTRLSESLDRPQQSVSLSDVLNRLEAALKKASRAKKGKGKQRQFSLGTPPLFPHHDYMSNGVLSRPASFGDLSSALLSSVQGKQKEFSSGNRTPNESAPRGSLELNRAPKAWWLDVASPTWDDLQAIGKLLHIHPLTLEDILQQDPREKMELFSRLGYYFISFRTIQNATVTQPGNDVYKADDGALREANIYVVVFKEGICTFYFTDVSEHIEKVRNRLQLLQDSFNMSSDWIAHGILDSVVDSFFPFLKEIEQQVLAVEALVFSSNDVSHTSSTNTLVDLIHIPADDQCDSDIEKLPDIPSKEMGETPPRYFPRFTQPLFFRRLKCSLQNLRNTFATTHKVRTQATTTNTLLRMARARRLVTSLTRLLATKSEVISQIRKRFLIGGRQTTSPQGNDDLEIAMYMGDVQDHILTLQQSLHHYEHMLSDSHPAYLTQLQTRLAMNKGYTDKAILVLSLISIGILCLQFPIGLFSQNIKIPKNSVHPPGPYNYFVMVILFSLSIGTVFLATVWRWWNQAKRTRSRLS